MALVTLRNSAGQTVTTEEGGAIYNSYLTGSHAKEGWIVVSAPPPSPVAVQPTAPTPTQKNKATSSDVVAAYNKYFNRPPTKDEKDWYTTQPISTLEEELLSTYKSATGLQAYDGSAVKPGFAQTQNQIAQMQQGGANRWRITPDTKNLYKATDYYQDSDGKWYLNEGVTPKSGQSNVTLVAGGKGGTAPTGTRQIYRIGADIYDASTNTKIGATDWANNWSGKSDVKEVSAPSSPPTGTSPASTPGQDFSNFSDLPAEILNNPDWAVLPDEYKKAFYATYHAQQLTSIASKQDAIAALKQAEQLADPIFKEALRISQDELTRTFGSTTGDFESNKKTLEDRINQLNEDLTYNRGQLSLSEQADLAQQANQYKTDLFNLQQNAAESGLAFSSPRRTAEANLSFQNQGLVTSTQRKYAQAQREQDFSASRGIAQNQQNITDLNRQYQENLAKIQRSGEATMGTANVGIIPGITPLGGIVGSLAEKKQADVFNLQGALMNRQNPFNFYA